MNFLFTNKKQLSPLKSREDVFREGDELLARIIEDRRRNDELFTDDDFPPNSVSLGSVAEWCQEWLRPEHIVVPLLQERRLEWSIFRDPHPCQVRQGSLGDCYLIAPLMTLTAHRQLLEQIVPNREDCLKYGVFQVRLFVDGQWKVVIVDSHFPCTDGLVFGRCAQKQLWVSIIEKAVAKVKGSYGNIIRGPIQAAYSMLTGLPTRNYDIKWFMNLDELWRLLTEAYASKSPVSVSVHKEEVNHGFAVINVTCDENGRRLVQVSNSLGNVSEKPSGWSNPRPDDVQEVESVLTEHELEYYKLVKEIRMQKGGSPDWPEYNEIMREKSFWMTLEEFRTWADSIYVLWYYPEWLMTEARQVVSGGDVTKRSLLRLTAQGEEHCRLTIGFKDLWHVQKFSLINSLNIHRALPDGRLGELVHSEIFGGLPFAPEPLVLEPGVYLVVYQRLRRRQYDMALDWTVQSTCPVTLDFVECDFATVTLSLQMFMVKHGKVVESEELDNDNAVVRCFANETAVLLMAENMNDDYSLSFNVNLSECNLCDGAYPDNDFFIDNSITRAVDAYLFNPQINVPPKSRRVFPCLVDTPEKGREENRDFKITYSKASWTTWIHEKIQALPDAVTQLIE